MQKMPTHKDKHVASVSSELVHGCNVMKHGGAQPAKKWSIGTLADKQIDAFGYVVFSARLNAQGP
jgi:hypothetical protein